MKDCFIRILLFITNHSLIGRGFQHIQFKAFSKEIKRICSSLRAAQVSYVTPGFF